MNKYGILQSEIFAILIILFLLVICVVANVPLAVESRNVTVEKTEQLQENNLLWGTHVTNYMTANDGTAYIVDEPRDLIALESGNSYTVTVSTIGGELHIMHVEKR